MTREPSFAPKLVELNQRANSALSFKRNHLGRCIASQSVGDDVVKALSLKQTREKSSDMICSSGGLVFCSGAQQPALSGTPPSNDLSNVLLSGLFTYEFSSWERTHAFWMSDLKVSLASALASRFTLILFGLMAAARGLATGENSHDKAIRTHTKSTEIQFTFDQKEWVNADSLRSLQQTSIAGGRS